MYNIAVVRFSNSEGWGQINSLLLFLFSSKGLFGLLKFFQRQTTSKKWTNKFDFSTIRQKNKTKTNSFVCFLEEPENNKSHFEIIWPLWTPQIQESHQYSLQQQPLLVGFYTISKRFLMVSNFKENVKKTSGQTKDYQITVLPKNN